MKFKILLLLLLFVNISFSKYDNVFLKYKNWKSTKLKKDIVALGKIKNIKLTQRFSKNNKQFKAFIIKGNTVNTLWLSDYKNGYIHKTNKIKTTVKKNNSQLMVIEEFKNKQKIKIYTKISKNQIFGIEFKNIALNNAIKIFREFKYNAIH